MLPQTGAHLVRYPILFLQLQAIFSSGGLLSPVWFVVILMTALNISPFSFMYGNPTTFGKDFSSYVKNNPVLFWIRLLLASFDIPQFCFQKRLQIPHLLSPECLGDWRLLVFSSSFTISPLANDCSVILCLKAVYTFSHPCCFWNFPSF